MKPEYNLPLVVAVVLTWNDTEMTTKCIDSVFKSDYENLQIVLVDNGSEPPGCPIVKKIFPNITTVQLDENKGFTGGCNRGIEKALEMDAEYVFLLNNDTVVHQQAVGKLVTVLEKTQDASLACPAILHPGDEKRIQFFTASINRNLARHIHYFENEKYSDQFHRTVETEFAPACAILYRSNTLQEIGLFDETLFTNWEDYDLNIRMMDAGWKLLTVGEAEVIHAHGQTTGRISPFITYLFTRNRLICLFRYGSITGILKQSPLYLRTLWWQMKGYGLDNWPAHAAFLKGILYFFLGVRGISGVPSETRDQ